MSRWLVPSPLNDWPKEKEHKKFRAQIKTGRRTRAWREKATSFLTCRPPFSRASFISRCMRPPRSLLRTAAKNWLLKIYSRYFFSNLVAFIPTRFKCQKANFPGVEFLEPALKLKKRRKKRQKLVVVGLSSIKRCVRRLHVVVDEQGRQRNVPKNMLIVY